MSKTRHFILIDDDHLQNKVTRINIIKALHAAKIEIFTSAEDALHYIRTADDAVKEPVIIFLDINMPGMNGWEFLDQYTTVSEKIRKHIRIYMVSSSIDVRDAEQAKANNCVEGFISKPVEQETIRQLAGM